jgi:hypothetical protein
VLALNLNPPHLCLLSSWYYRCEPLAPGSFLFFFLSILNASIFKLEKVTHACHPNYWGRQRQEDGDFEVSPSKGSKTLSQKIKYKPGSGGSHL